MIFFYNVQGMDVIGVFLCIVAFRISLPLDEVLEAF